MSTRFSHGPGRKNSSATRTGRPRRRGPRRLLHLFRPAWERMEDRTLLATMLWTNAAGGDWDVASNWVNAANPSDQHVPTSSDDAEINMSGITVTHSTSASDSVNSVTVASGTTLSLSSGTLAIASASTISGNLTMSGGTLSTAGSLTVSGATTWTGGTMSGTGTTSTDGGLTLGSATSYDQMFLTGQTLDNFGAATLSDPNNTNYGLFLGSGATLDNEAGASFAFATNTYIISSGGSPAGGTFVNAGTLSNTGGTGTSVIESGITLNDSGMIQASTGTLSLQGGGTFTGTANLTAAAGADLDFGGGTYTAPAGSSFSGAGTISFSSGTVTVDGTYDVSGSTIARGGTANLTAPVTAVGATITVSGGALNLSGTDPALTATAVNVSGGTLDLSGVPELTTTTLNVSGGTLTAIATLNVSGQTTWTGGTMSGTGTTSTDGGLTLGSATSYDQMFLTGQTLDNFGAATLSDPNNTNYGLFLGSGATLDNEAGASFAFATNTYIISSGGSPAGGTFVNAGTLSSTGGTGTSVIESGITLNDSGMIQASTGTLSLQGGGTFTGTANLTAAAGADLDFGGGTYTAPAGSSFSGAGTISFSSGTVTVDGTYDVSGSTIARGGTANLTAPVTAVGATITVSGGALNLSGTDPALTATAVNVSGGTLDLSGVPELTTTTLNVSGGTLTAIATLNVSGQTTWTGGTMSGTGTTSTDGGLTLGSATSYDQMFLTGQTLDNFGAATLSDPNNTNYGLFLGSGATLDNEAGASFAFATNTYIISSGGSPAGGTFVNAGTLSSTGGTGTSVIESGITLNDSGMIQASTGTLSLQGGGTFTGTIEATSGGSLSISPPPTNLASGTLTGGTWIVGANSSMSLGANITTDDATIILDGSGASFSSLSPLAKIALAGSLEVQVGGSLTTAGNLDNAGTIDLAPGALNVTGSYTQETTGALDIGVGGLAAGSQFGQLNVSGPASLNGVLDVSLVNGYTPPSGDSYPILTFGSETGGFSADFGLFFGNGQGFVPTFSPATNPTALDLVVTSGLPGTQTTLSTSPDPSVYGQSVTFTATVAPTAPTSTPLTGNVTFYDGGTDLGSVPVSQGVATYTTASLAPGSHSIVAEYSEDPNFSGSNSTALTETVGQDGSATVVSSSADPSALGQSVTFTATVSAAAPGSGTPTGTVVFYDGSTAIDTTTLSGGSASYTTSSLAIGGHSITAQYLGDPNFTGSTSPAVTQTVDQEIMIWTNAAGGDWDTASNWVNAANPSDHHVPASFDDVQINIKGITVTHTSNTSDSIKSLTVASGTTLSSRAARCRSPRPPPTPAPWRSARLPWPEPGR